MEKNLNRIETERLFLKLYQKEDKTELINLTTDDLVMKNIGDGVFSVEQSEKFWQKLMEDFYPKNINTIWGVFAKGDNRYIGSASIRPRPEQTEDWEIVYILKKEEWGKGFATEIARRLVEYGFTNLNLNEVFATVDEEHAASINVLTKIGMKFLNYEYDEQGRFPVYSIRRG